MASLLPAAAVAVVLVIIVVLAILAAIATRSSRAPKRPARASGGAELLPVAPPTSAVAVFGRGPVEGWVEFEQPVGVDALTIRAHVRGLAKGDHGIHVHEKGDLRGDGCGGACAHFNPQKTAHGGLHDRVRHVGDWGNLRSAGVDSWMDVTLVDDAPLGARLRGLHSIVGRSVVLHSGADDLGRGAGARAAESKITGNAGHRIACAVIGIA